MRNTRIVAIALFMAFCVSVRFISQTTFARDESSPVGWPFLPVDRTQCNETKSLLGQKWPSYVKATTPHALHNVGHDVLCDDRTFIRRLAFDLLGEPPTDAIVDEFIQDTSANKREKWTEAFLNRPEYGKRWGRWLTLRMGANRDQLIYSSGETGLSADQLFHCWLLWTQTRVQDDMPYDQLVENCIVASSRDGRNRSEYRNWLETWRGKAKNGFESSKLYAQKTTNDVFWRRYLMSFDAEIRGEEIASRILGTKLECARCHDHPTQAITQADHRAFAAAFSPIRYSEYTIADSQKGWAVGLAITLATGLIGGFGYMLIRIPRNWGRALWPALLTTFGALLYVVACYLYLVGGLVPKLWSPAEWIVSHRAHSIASFILVSIFVGMLFVPNNTVRRVAFLLVGLSAVALFDVASQWQYAGSSNRTTSLVHRGHRELIRILGLGGVGSVPRETFVDLQYASQKKVRLLDGSEFEIKLKDPRLDLMDWLRREDVHYLENALARDIWMQYFGHEVQDAQLEVAEEGSLSRIQELAKGFRDSGWSMRWLHRMIVLSDRYQRPAVRTVRDEASDDNTAASVFDPRPLTSEQLIRSVDWLSGVTSKFDTVTLPANGTVYDLATDYPFSQDFAGTLVRLYPPGERPYSNTREGALLFSVSKDLQARFRANEGWLMQRLNQQVPLEQLVREAFQRGTGFPPTEEWVRTCVSEKSPEESDLDFMVEVLMSIVASPSFQLLY